MHDEAEEVPFGNEQEKDTITHQRVKMENLDLDLFETIEAYVRGTLSEEDRKAFETKLSSDPELQKEVEIMRDDILAVELGAFTSSIKDISKEYDQKNPSISRKSNGLNIKFWAIAAGLALLLSLGFWIFNNAPSPDNLYTEHFTTDPGLPVSMGSTSTYEFSDAMVDYKAGKYEKAISKWTELSVSDQRNDTLKYYIASSFLNSEKFSEAIPLLEEVSSMPVSKFQSKAQWYLMLAYLKTGQMEKFKALDTENNKDYAKRIESLRKSVSEL